MKEGLTNDVPESPFWAFTSSWKEAGCCCCVKIRKTCGLSRLQLVTKVVSGYVPPQDLMNAGLIGFQVCKSFIIINSVACRVREIYSKSERVRERERTNFLKEKVSDRLADWEWVSEWLTGRSLHGMWSSFNDMRAGRQWHIPERIIIM